MAGYSPAVSINSYGLGSMNTATNVWYSWNNIYNVGTNAVTAMTGVDPWAPWNQTYAGQPIYATQLASTYDPWVSWMVQYYQITTGQITTPAVVESAEQRTAREERALIAKREREMLEAKRAAAKIKARATLKSILSRQQQEEFEKDGTFMLQVNDRLYRIRPGSRVERLCPLTKKIQSYFCIHPENNYELPYEDIAISQKLYLESDEASFLKLANETRAA